MMRPMVMLLLFAFACQPSLGPSEPIWGKQACAHCMMLLSEPRSAAQAQLADGSHVFFDDFGCLAEWLARDSEVVRGTWVRAHAGKGWVEAERTRYATGQRTPMDYGLLPSDQGLSYEAARKLIAQQSAMRKEVTP